MNDQIPIGLIGISHKTASVEIREQVALSEEEQKIAIKKIISDFNINGCLVVSTCNRTEIYISGEDYIAQLPKIRSWLNTYKKCQYFTDDQITYQMVGSEAIKHFFEVISGLDSQILGEPQITGQVKDSYNLAHELQATDTVINKLFNFGMQAEKKVRSDTFLSDGAVSISFAGVKLARKIFNNLRNKEILLIGAGETAELAAFHFLERGVENIHVANRTYSRAKALADKFGGMAFKLSELQTVLMQIDIVISATSSQKYVVTKEMMNQICRERHHEPIFLIDLAIPRDIDPEIDNIDGVYLYNLDDLHEIVQMNLEKREQEIPKSLKIIDEYIIEYRQWMSSHSMASIITRLKNHFDSLRIKELERLKNRLPKEGFDEIEYLTQSIINKLMHQHIKLLKTDASDPDLYQQHVEFILNMYELEDE